MRRLEEGKEKMKCEKIGWKGDVEGLDEGNRKDDKDRKKKKEKKKIEIGVKKKI